MVSILWRCRQGTGSWGTGRARPLRAGMQGAMPRSARASPNQSALAIVLEPVADDGSMASVREKHLSLRQRRQKRPCPDMVAGLTGQEDHADRATPGGDVELGVQAALGAPDRTSPLVAAAPFFPRGLEAARCAFRCPRQWFLDQWRTTASTSIIGVSVS